MNRNFIILSFISALIVSCGASEDKNKDSDLAKKEYKEEVGEVTVISLAEKEFNKQLISNGKLEAQKKSVLNFETQGVITAINVKEGDSVEYGDVIALVDKSDAETDLELAKLALEKAEMDYADKLLDYGYLISDSLTIPAENKRVASIRSGLIDARFALQKAEKTLERSTLTAPFSGKIASVESRIYEVSSKEVCTLIDDKVMSVKFSVLESELNLVKKGYSVKIVPFNDPDKRIDGVITTINPLVEEKGHVEITASIKNNVNLLDGQNVKIIVENIVPGQLVVPKSAVVVRDNMDVLFVCKNGRAIWTYVNIVMTNSTEYVVAPNQDRNSELVVGDSIIVTGNLNLGDNAKIKVVK